MTAPPAKRQPIPFGQYLLLDRINIGGMAEVWRGKMFGAGGFERLVAIKRILPNIAEDEEFITMFLDEAKITVQLAHANVAQVYDLNKVQNSYYIAMEYVPGKDMRAIFDRCRKKGEPAPVPLTCFVISKMCEGLDYAHRKKDTMGRDMNIVHRDISPQNVLISYEGEVKVIDFGIAKAAGKASKTQAGILKGKFAYMSPEQIRGLPLDRRSDVFAAGVCLYEMLTGERLFVGDSDFSVLEKVRKAEVLPPSTFNRRIPEALEKIVLKALAKDVEDRYQYCSDLADDLQRFLITSDSIFSRKDLMQYMKSTFAEDVEREKLRLQDYAGVKPSEGMLAAIEMGLAGASPGAAPSGPVAPIPLTTQAMPGRASSPNIPALGAAQAPPTLTPAAAPPTLTPAQPSGPRRSPSLSSMPRLTAAAPMLGNPQDDEGGATMLVDGANYFGDGANPEAGPQGARPPALTPQPAVDLNVEHASTAVVGPPGTSGLTPQVSPGKRPTGERAAVSTPAPQRRPSQPQPSFGRPVARPPDPDLEAEDDFPEKDEDFEENTLPTSPSLAGAARPPRPAGPGLNMGLLALIGGAVLLVLAGVGFVLFKGPGEGMLYIEIPRELQGKARLNINGQDLGPGVSWPYLGPVPAGPTAVMITADGWETFVGTVQVQEGRDVTRYAPPLKQDVVFAPLAVSFTPEEAEVLIDGKVVKPQGERSGPYLGELQVGKEAVVEVRMPGYEPFGQKVAPAGKGPVKVSARLRALDVTVKVDSSPVGARIYVEGRDRGQTPATLRLSPSVRTLTLKKRCYDDKEVGLSGQAGEVTARLKRQRGCR